MKNIELDSPASLSAAGRAAEITHMLANALIRSLPNDKEGVVRLGFWREKSVHAPTPLTGRLS